MFKRCTALFLTLMLAMGVVAPSAMASDTFATINMDGASTVLKGGAGPYFFATNAPLQDVVVTSSNPNVLRVGETESKTSVVNGVTVHTVLFPCYGLQVGTVTLTATSRTDATVSDAMVINVTDVPNKLRVTSSSLPRLKPGGSCTMYAYGFLNDDYSSAACMKSGVKWTSSNKKIATVNAKTGKVKISKKAKSGKKVTITGSYKGKKAKYTITVVAKAAKITRVYLGAPLYYEEIAPGQSYFLDPTTYYRKAKKAGPVSKVTFTSSNPSVATVDACGHVLGKRSGTTKITAKVAGKKDAITFIVVGLDALNL